MTTKILPGNLIAGSWENILNLFNGLLIDTLEAEVSLSPSAANFSITKTIPAGAIVLLAQLDIPATVSATTATKIGLGISSDPDKYALSAALTAEDVGGLTNWATAAIPLSSTETIRVSACDNAGAAAGTIGGTGQLVKVRLTWIRPDTL